MIDNIIKEYDRHQVYLACLLASSQGVDCMAFGNACDRSNKGQYKSEFYQNIAAKYYEEANKLGREKCWDLYCTDARTTNEYATQKK